MVIYYIFSLGRQIDLLHKHKITHPSASPLTVETLREFYVIRLLYLKIGVIKLAYGTYYGKYNTYF